MRYRKIIVSLIEIWVSAFICCFSTTVKYRLFLQLKKISVSKQHNSKAAKIPHNSKFLLSQI